MPSDILADRLKVWLNGVEVTAWDQKQYPTTLVSAAQKALYDNLDGNEELAIQIDTEIRKELFEPTYI